MEKYKITLVATFDDTDTWITEHAGYGGPLSFLDGVITDIFEEADFEDIIKVDEIERII